MYHAEVLDIDISTATCTILFPEYGNRQFKTPLAELVGLAAGAPAPQPSVSGPQAVPGLTGLPLPTGAAAEDSLASMIMAWYQSGFYTGYYQGLMQGRR